MSHFYSGATLRPPRMNPVSPRNKPPYRSEFNERARRGFCYWLLENTPPKCKFEKMDEVRLMVLKLHQCNIYLVYNVAFFLVIRLLDQ